MILSDIGQNCLFPYIGRGSHRALTRLTLSRSSSQTLLLFFILYLATTQLHATPIAVHGQNDQITVAKKDLLAAFQSVQLAEQQGASNESIAPLISELNSALAYEMIAEQGNSTAALQSINMSTDVSLKAQTLANQAQATSREKTILEYSIAIALAFATAVAVLGTSRLKRELDKRKLFRSRIELRD